MRMPLSITPLKMYKTRVGKLFLIVACMFGIMSGMCWLFNMLWISEVLPGLIYGIPQNERPTITQRKMIPPGKLTDIAVNDKSVFLLYASAGIVNAYSHEGEMMYTIYFPEQSNGSASLYANGNDLYYQNRWDNIWHIKGGAYQQYWEYSKGTEKLKELEASDPSHRDTICQYGDLRYEIREQDVFCAYPDGTQKQFVNGPDVLALFEFTPLWFIGFYSFAAAIGMFALTSYVEKRCKRYNKK